MGTLKKKQSLGCPKPVYYHRDPSGSDLYFLIDAVSALRFVITLMVEKCRPK